MIYNYLITSLRILFKEKLYSIINVLGLAVGLCTIFFIYSWVQFEMSYDTHFPEVDKTYRLITQWEDANEESFASTYPMIKTKVLSQFPEILESTRVFDTGFLGGKTQVTYQDNIFTDNNFYYADPSFFKVFPLAMIQGDRLTALKKPNAIVITQNMADRLFGQEDPIGQVILVEEDQEFEITGVCENIPLNTHFNFDLIASTQAHPWIKDAEEALWSGIVFHTYAQLKEGTSPAALEAKIAQVLDNFPNDPDRYGQALDIRLQAVRDIHLHAHAKFELQSNGNIIYVYMFVTIALLILVIAIFNYINLATARHTQRFKEVGVRKVFGANRKQLILQFIIESFLLTAVACVVAGLFIEFLRPFLIEMMGEHYFTHHFYQPLVLLAGLLVVLLISLFTGLVPAIILSAFRPILLFRPNFKASATGSSLRKSLVIFQFTISILLTICTVIIHQQLTYVQDKKLGYDPASIMVLNVSPNEVHAKREVLKTELLSNTSVKGVTATSQLPTDIQTSEGIDVAPSNSYDVHYISVDPDFFKVMGIDIKQGTSQISRVKPSDSLTHFVLNESALQNIGWQADNVLDQSLSIRHGSQLPGPVVGLIHDFHFQSLHNPISPLVIEFTPNRYRFLLVKIQSDKIQEVLPFIKNTWDNVAGGVPFEYDFLDDRYNQLYQNEKRTGQLFTVFSIVALLIALLGLFGLASFVVTRRTKEISIRKILGASISHILRLISRDFAIMLLIASILALPLGYYLMNTWLANFAYRIPMGFGVFILAGLANFILAILAITYHILKVSKTNPAETLRYE